MVKDVDPAGRVLLPLFPRVFIAYASEHVFIVWDAALCVVD